MKKILILLTFIASSLTTMAQSGKLENDTITYNKTKLYVGKEIHILYGSNATKDFAFIYIGSILSGQTPMTAGYSKQTIIINKLINSHNKCWIRGKIIGLNTIGLSVFVDVEGAIDNREIKEDN